MFPKICACALLGFFLDASLASRFSSIFMKVSSLETESVLVYSEPVTHYKFEGFPSNPFFAAPQLGYYGSYGGDYGYDGPFKQPPLFPSPIQFLNWNGWFVMNNSTAKLEQDNDIQYATPILEPASGKNVLIGYNNSGIPSFMSRGGSYVQNFNVSSLYTACFVDYEGAQGRYGSYYMDIKTAVDCLISFSGVKVSSGDIVTQHFNYTGGCVLPGSGNKGSIYHCPQTGRPMQKVQFSEMNGLEQLNVQVSAVFYKKPTGGYHYTGASEIIFAIDDMAYSVEYNLHG